MASAGRSRGAIISQYYSRTVKLRRRAGRPQLRDMGRSARPSLRLYDLELDSAVLEEEGEWGWGGASLWRTSAGGVGAGVKRAV